MKQRLTFYLMLKKHFILYAAQVIALSVLLLCNLQQASGYNNNLNKVISTRSLTVGNVTGSASPYGIALDGTGNTYLAGNLIGTVDFDPGPSTALLTSAGGSDIYVSKYSADGSYVWAIGIGGTATDGGYGVAADSMGNVYVTGSFLGLIDFDPGPDSAILTAIGSTDIFVAKYDSNGNYVWAISMGGTATEQGYGLVVDAVGNIFVTGIFSSATVDFDPGPGTALLSAQSGVTVNTFIAKYDANGNYLWAKGMSRARGYSITIDDSDNLYLTGDFAGSTDFDPGPGTAILTATGSSYDAFVAKYDTSGNYIWAISMGGTAAEQGNGLVVDAVGNVFVTGTFISATADFDPGPGTAILTNPAGSNVFLAKYDPSGNYQWALGIGDIGLNTGNGLALDAMGNVYVTGGFNNLVDFDPGPDTAILTAVSTDMFVAKYDSNGNYVWAESLGGAGVDAGRGVVVDRSNSVYVVGSIASPIGYFNPSGANIPVTTGAGATFVLKLSCRSFVSITHTACDRFTFNGVTYTASGAYTDTFTNAAACDSFVTLHLTITSSSANPIVTGHYCDSVTFNDVTYTSSGTYTQQYRNVAGCDSSITYALTIGKSNGSSDAQLACDSFMLDDVRVFATSGIHTITYTNKSGCDSVVQLVLIINPSPIASIASNGTTLTAGSSMGIGYQWVDCANGFAIIPGATGQSYTPEKNGNYAVIVTSHFGCSDTSECHSVEGNATVHELGSGNRLQLYPNPTEVQVTIQAEQPFRNATIRLVNMAGQVLTEQANLQGQLISLDMMKYAGGVYFVEVSEEGKTVRMKLVKHE